ncbi:MAG TPA: universal stress protein [Chloroflexota bacterium]|jgi:nucleotide-binding universal stress UspA family protein
MFERILVPLDGTPQSAVALPLARTLARACHSQITLIRVAAAPAEREEAGRYLAKIAGELQAETFTVATQVWSGIDVASQLLWAIGEAEADVVVMSTHGRSGIRRAVMGSVAESVVSQSRVPVLLVRPGGKRSTNLRTLLVPVDGTPGGALALGHAVGLARSTGARLVLLEVVVPIPLWLYSAGLGAAPNVPIDPSWDDDALRSAQSYVDALARRLRDVGIAAEAKAGAGDVVRTIEEEADRIDADLIVIATHARVGAARATLGSTADALVRTAKRPVLLVRRQSHAPSTTAALGALAITT